VQIIGTFGDGGEKEIYLLFVCLQPDFNKQSFHLQDEGIKKYLKVTKTR